MKFRLKPSRDVKPWNGVRNGVAYVGAIVIKDDRPQLVFYDDNGDWQTANLWQFEPVE